MQRFPVVFAVSCVLALGAAPAHANLVARWSFDEGGGASAIDSVGGFDAALQGSASIAANGGISGGALVLDESTAALANAGDHLEFLGTTTFSIQAWVNTTRTTGALVVGRHVTNYLNGYWLGLNDTGDGDPHELSGSFHLYQSDNPQLDSGNRNINDGQWHQIVGVRDSSANQIRLYVDGQRVPTASSTGSLVSIIDTPAPFLIGGAVVGGTPTNTYTGMIDEVRVWNTALSDEDVSFYFQHPWSVNTVLCGDANRNGSISATDAQVALRAATELGSCLGCICDVNDSGSISTLDALIILKRAVGQNIAMECPVCIEPATAALP